MHRKGSKALKEGTFEVCLDAGWGWTRGSELQFCGARTAWRPRRVPHMDRQVRKWQV